MDYESMQEKARTAEQRTALSKEMRQAKQELAAAKVAEERAERKYKEARDQRRIAEWRLEQIQQFRGKGA